MADADKANEKPKRKRGKPKGLPPPKSAWKKGQSGNPRGMPRVEEVQRFREALKDALDPKLVAAMLTDLINHPDPLVSLRALNMYLDRYLGKPEQAVEVSTPDGGAAIKVIYRMPDNGRRKNK